MPDKVSVPWNEIVRYSRLYINLGLNINLEMYINLETYINLGLYVNLVMYINSKFYVNFLWGSRKSKMFQTLKNALKIHLRTLILKIIEKYLN